MTNVLPWLYKTADEVVVVRRVQQEAALEQTGYTSDNCPSLYEFSSKPLMEQPNLALATR